MPLLKAIRRYPIKGMKPQHLEAAKIERRGLAHDRRWMLVDANGRFISQREHARLALMEVEVTTAGLRVQAPGAEPLSVQKPLPEVARRTVQIWDDAVEAVLADERAHRWFSKVVGFDCQLVYMDEAAARPVDATYAVRSTDEVNFADGYPVLLTTEASLADLNARLKTPVPMERFRPNLFVAGCAPFEEDTWRQIRIGEVAFHVVKPCARCVVTTIDQDSGLAGKEPLRTLATFRNQGNKVYFGQNLIPDAPGIIRVGDRVEVVTRSVRTVVL